MRREGLFRRTAKRRLDDAIHAGRTLAARHAGVLFAYESLLWHAQTRTALLRPSGRAGDHRNGLNAGLLALAFYRRDWLRAVETWQPVKQNAWPLFAALTQHLFARELPPFMPALTRAVEATRLGKPLENDGFWEGALQFLVNHLESGWERIRSVVHVSQGQRPQTVEAVAPDDVEELPPQAEERHEDPARKSSQPAVCWPRSPYSDFRFVQMEGGMRVWTITELLSRGELRREGHAMRHCVAAYQEECARREASIWSMQVEVHSGRHRVLTIEVDIPEQTICQVRGRCNRRPSDEELSIVKRWAAAEGLRI